MTARRAIAGGLTRPAIGWACFVLIGLIGQMVLMGAARPGEMPRATLERLTGHVVTQATVMTPDCDMAMGNMPMPTDHQKPGHDADAACFLCPLLTLGPVIFQTLPPLPAPTVLVRRIMRGFAAARAPPSLPWQRALARGPPALFTTG